MDYDKLWWVPLIISIVSLLLVICKPLLLGMLR